MTKISSGGHKGLNASSSKTDLLPSSVQRALKCPGISQVLDGLGIKPENIATISRSPVQLEQPMKSIESMAMLQIQPDHAQLLATLGLGSVDAALIIQAESETKKALKKALKEVQKSTLNSQEVSSILSALGVSSQVSNLVFSDGQGGLIILQSALKEIESFFNDDDEDS